MRTERWGLMALLVVTVVWGTTFPAMKLLSAHLDALQIIWLRFAIALVVLLPFPAMALSFWWISRHVHEASHQALNAFLAGALEIAGA